MMSLKDELFSDNGNMRIKKKIKVKYRWVQAILYNTLVRLSVSHKEFWEPSSGDGDFVEPVTYLICALPDTKVKPMELARKNNKAPKLFMPIGSVLFEKNEKTKIN
jgi:hypothetical protein